MNNISHLISSLSKLLLRITRSKKDLLKDIKLLDLSEEEIIKAKKSLDEWLSRPNALGYSPDKIEFIKAFMDSNCNICIILKYKNTPKSPWLLGIVSNSWAFSKMKKYHKSRELIDSLKLLEILKSYYQKIFAINKEDKLTRYYLFILAGTLFFSSIFRLTSVLIILYNIEHKGTLKIIPKTPYMLAPIVTATITHILGRPTDLPTTLG